MKVALHVISCTMNVNISQQATGGELDLLRNESTQYLRCQSRLPLKVVIKWAFCKALLAFLKISTMLVKRFLLQKDTV